MVAYLLDNVGVRTATTGTGSPLTLGDGVKLKPTALLSFAQHPNAVSGRNYSYKIIDGAGFEDCDGVWDQAANTITRTTYLSFDGTTVSTSPLDLSGNAFIVCVLRAADYATLADLSAAVTASAASAAASATSASGAATSAAAAAVSAAAADPTPRILRAGDQMTGPLDWKTAVTVASATTTDIGAGTSNLVTISGTTTITGLGTKASGATRWVRFSGALTLTHNSTTLILPGGANITTAAGDTALFVSEGSGNWRCWDYQKASGLATIAAPVGYISITSGSFGVGTSLVLTSLPQGYSDLLFAAKGVSHNSGGSAAIALDVSVNNGSAYSATAAPITATFAGASSRDFLMLFSRYAADTGAVTCVSAAPPTSPDVAAAVVTGVNTAHTGGCNAIKVSVGGGANYDAGTYALFGRP